MYAHWQEFFIGKEGQGLWEEEAAIHMNMHEYTARPACKQRAGDQHTQGMWHHARLQIKLHI